jgi:hypothetical protein
MSHQDREADAVPALSENPSPADGLVVFGITGDLARKMTLRSLYRLKREAGSAAPSLALPASSGPTTPCMNT